MEATIRPMRIVVGGPNDSRKSAVIGSLFAKLYDSGISVSTHSLHTVYRDGKRRGLGTKATLRHIAAFTDDRHEVVLAELPGNFKHHQLRAMVAPASCGLIVDYDPLSMNQWMAYFLDRRVPILGKVLLPPPPKKATGLEVIPLRRQVTLRGLTNIIVRLRREHWYLPTELETDNKDDA